MAEDVKVEKHRSGIPNNHIPIAGKPFMNYVRGTVMQIMSDPSREVIIQARGNFISRAVDVAQVALTNFLKETASVKDVKIGSTYFDDKDENGKKVRCSTIEITIALK